MKWMRMAAAALAALATVSVSVPAYAQAQPNACKTTCNNNYQQCLRSSPDETRCLRAWTQCKNRCNPPRPAAKATPATPAQPATPPRKGGR